MSNSHSSNLEDTQNQLALCQKELAHARKKLDKVQRKLLKVQNYNNDLIDELDDLKKQIRKSRRSKRVKHSTVGTQTELGCEETNLLVQPPDASTTSPQQAEAVDERVFEPLQESVTTDNGETLNIADQLRSAAEQAVSQSDYVYDDSSGQYYDQQTGYYYNPESKLYYDSTNYCYYSFNERTQQYQFHSQADMSQYNEYYKHQAIKNEKLARKAVKQAKKEAKLAKQELKRICQPNQVQDGLDDLRTEAKRARKDALSASFETADKEQPSPLDVVGNQSELSHHSSSTEEGEVDSSDGELSSISESADEEKEVTWRPPCVRAIVEESQSIDVGNLHIITINGGTVGSADGVDIHIPEESVSEAHCKLSYSQESYGYYLVELGSVSGTFINNTRLSQPRESASIRLSNRDYIQVGSTKLVLHIHPGTDTCTDCEPGVIETRLRASHQQSDKSVKCKADVERERRSQLKSIKKKYGLENEKYKQGPSEKSSKYEDKAEKRRQTHGVELPGLPDAAAASVDAAIPSENLGHKLLQKMGWKSGQSLGKSEEGIVEPIKVDLRLNSSAGLGSQSNRTVSMDDGGNLPKARRKAEMQLKVQRRFEQAKRASLFDEVSDEEGDADNPSK